MITIKEVAEEAGVSITTVSNVINGKTNKVSPKMLTQIKDILKKNNYVPRFGLKALTNKKSNIIGILINTPEFIELSPYVHPFYGSIIGILEAEFRKLGYYIMIFSSKNTQDIVTMALGWNVDGIIGLSLNKKEYDDISELTGKPVVSVDINEDFPENTWDVYSIISDDYNAGKKMVDYILSRGIKKLFFYSNSKHGADFRRYTGASDAYKKATGEELEHILLNESYEKRVIQYDECIRYADTKTAVFFSTDLNAVEAINCLQEKGISVPKDISVAGCDDNAYAKLCRGGLTTIRISVEDKAKAAIHMLEDLIDKREITKKNIITDVHLVKRGTVQ